MMKLGDFSSDTFKFFPLNFNLILDIPTLGLFVNKHSCSGGGGGLGVISGSVRGELLGLVLGPDGLGVLLRVIPVRRPQGGLHRSSRYEISSKSCSWARDSIIYRSREFIGGAAVLFRSSVREMASSRGISVCSVCFSFLNYYS